MLFEGAERDRNFHSNIKTRHGVNEFKIRKEGTNRKRKQKGQNPWGKRGGGQGLHNLENYGKPARAMLEGGGSNLGSLKEGRYVSGSGGFTIGGDHTGGGGRKKEVKKRKTKSSLEPAGGNYVNRDLVGRTGSKMWILQGKIAWRAKIRQSDYGGKEAPIGERFCPDVGSEVNQRKRRTHWVRAKSAMGGGGGTSPKSEARGGGRCRVVFKGGRGVVRASLEQGRMDWAKKYSKRKVKGREF